MYEPITVTGCNPTLIPHVTVHIHSFFPTPTLHLTLSCTFAHFLYLPHLWLHLQFLFFLLFPLRIFFLRLRLHLLSPLHRLVHVSPHYVIRSRAYVSDLQTFLVYNNLFGSSLTSLYVTITIRIFGGFQAVTNANRLHIGLAFCATCLDFKSCACRNVICWCSHQHYFAWRTIARPKTVYN